MTSYSVSAVARISGVTVRTLHHYDEIGLLTPSGRTAAGYRRYHEADLERLHRILTYRELGFPLTEIAAILRESSTETLTHLRRQHALLLARAERLRRLADQIEFMMEAKQMGIELTEQERFEIFGEHDPVHYAAETEQRWGDTEAYRESKRRAAGYRKEDWRRMKEETDALYREIATVMAAGVAAGSAPAMELAERHRSQIGEWFYDCTYDIHRGLAEMYMADHRFTQTLDRYGPGLAGYLREAILANAARAGH